MALDSTINIQGTPLTEAEAQALPIAAGKRLLFPNSNKNNEPYWVDSSGNLYPAMVVIDTALGADTLLINGTSLSVDNSVGSGFFQLGFLRQGPNISEAITVAFSDLPPGLTIADQTLAADQLLKTDFAYTQSGLATGTTLATVTLTYGSSIFVQKINVTAGS